MKRIPVLKFILFALSVILNGYFLVRYFVTSDYPKTESELVLYHNSSMKISNKLILQEIDTFITQIERKKFPGKIAYELAIGEDFEDVTGIYLSAALDRETFNDKHPFGYFVYKGRTIFVYTGLLRLLEANINRKPTSLPKASMFFSNSDSLNQSSTYFGENVNSSLKAYSKTFDQSWGLCRFLNVYNDRVTRKTVWNWSVIEIPFLRENFILTPPNGNITNWP